MTRLTYKQKSGLYWFAVVLIVLIVMALSGCSANYHLRMAKKKGAELTMDTIIFHFKSPEIKFSTTIKPTWNKLSLSKDTLIAKDKKTGATVKAKIDLKEGCPEDCIETVYLAADCPPQDLTAKVPCVTEISAGHGFWYDVKLVLISLVAGALAMFILIRRGPLRNFNFRIENQKPP